MLLFFIMVRSFSCPGSTPVCGVFFFQDERVQIITHVRPEKKTHHTPGATQGSLTNAPYVLGFTTACVFVLIAPDEVLVVNESS